MHREETSRTGRDTHGRRPPLSVPDDFWEDEEDEHVVNGIIPLLVLDEDVGNPHEGDDETKEEEDEPLPMEEQRLPEIFFGFSSEEVVLSKESERRFWETLPSKTKRSFLSHLKLFVLDAKFPNLISDVLNASWEAILEADKSQPYHNPHAVEGRDEYIRGMSFNSELFPNLHYESVHNKISKSHRPIALTPN